MLPDVTSDAVVQAARNLDLKFTESFFYKVALEAGFTAKNAEDKARELQVIWTRRGFMSLPLWVRSYAERVAVKTQDVFSDTPIS